MKKYLLIAQMAKPKMMAGMDPTKLMQGKKGFEPSFYGMNQKFFGGIDS